MIERYLLRQILWPTLAAAAALGAVALLSQTLSTLDIVVDQRQSALTFLKIVALGMPSLLTVVLPIAVFVAGLLALNRLHTEQELVVCFAAGVSRWRVAAPAVKLATVAALLTLTVNLWIQPWCAREVQRELFRVRTDLAASLVREGVFTSPSPDLTVYAQSVDADGQLRNVFIHRRRGGDGSDSFIAKRGVIGKQAGKPVLLLKDGSQQGFDSHHVLTFLAFEENVFDLAPYVSTDEVVTFKGSQRYLHELIAPDRRNTWDRRNKKKYLAEAQSRLASPLYNLTFIMLALHAVIGGAFSRIGYARRIAMASIAAIVIRILGFGAQAASEGVVWLNLLQYLVPILPLWWAAQRLFGRAARIRSVGRIRATGRAGGLVPLSAST